MPKINFNAMKQKMRSLGEKIQEVRKLNIEKIKVTESKLNDLDYKNYESCLQIVIDYYNLDFQKKCLIELGARLQSLENESAKIKLT